MWAGGTFFTVVLLCQFLVLAGNRFWFYLLCTYVLRVQYSCGVVLVFGSDRKYFWCYVCTQCTIQLCGCVSFLVVAGNCSLNENMLLQKNLIGLLFMICQPMCVFIRPNTLLLCIFLFCIFLLYRTDPQVEVQIRILLKDKYRKSGNPTLIF